MLYKELKEMKVKDWDGKPFEAYYTDCNDCAEVDGVVIKIVGFSYDKWIGECFGFGGEWKHVYPVAWNKNKVEEALKPKRMTYRQLARWMANGNGEFINKHKFICAAIGYDSCKGDEQVESAIKVRKWGSDEWIEPTADLLEEK